MNHTSNLSRFLDAQEGMYETALREIKSGRKMSHWMWFIFPQLSGLGRSQTATFFAIQGKDEAVTYLKDPVLGPRLLNLCKELLALETSDPVRIFGSIDSMKLRSSMTLFAQVAPAEPLFEKVLNRFYGGHRDDLTLRLLNEA